MDRVYVDTPRLRTHCLVWGPEAGVPVLLVHGNITTGRFWKAVADRFPDGFRLVAPDLRSFGRTEPKPVDARRGLRDWSDDLRALVETLGWADTGRLHLAGWSMAAGSHSSTPSTTAATWPPSRSSPPSPPSVSAPPGTPGAR